MLSWSMATSLLIFIWSLATTITTYSTMTWTYSDLSPTVMTTWVPKLERLVTLIYMGVWWSRVFSSAFGMGKLFLGDGFIGLILNFLFDHIWIVRWTLFFWKKWYFIVRCTINSSRHFLSIFFFLWQILLNFLMWKQETTLLMSNCTNIIQFSFLLCWPLQHYLGLQKFLPFCNF